MGVNTLSQHTGRIPETASSLGAACRCCGGRDFRALFEKEGYAYARCRDCGTACCNGKDYRSSAKEAYEHLYARFSGFDTLTEGRYRERLAALERFRKHGRLLDVGCGAGHFLLVAKQLGWKAEGTEIAHAAGDLGERLGLTVHLGALPELNLSSGSFDIVSMLELIEHIDDPNQYLSECFRILRPGGSLLLSTPNYDSLNRRLIGREWRIFSPEHVHYFTRRSLSTLLRRTGFSYAEITAVNWNPYDVLAGRRGAWLRGFSDRPIAQSASAPRAAEQALRHRIYGSGMLRSAKVAVNALLSFLGVGDTLWGQATK